MSAAKPSAKSPPLPPSQVVQANSATRALDIVGDRWTLMILHLAFFQVRRFDVFQSRIGLARSLLTDRLKRLEAAGIFKRERYQEKPPRDEYKLTEMGRDIYSLALMIVRWEKRWFYDAKNPSHRLQHACGRDFTPQLRCAYCNEEITSRDVYSIDGPGVGVDPRQRPRAQRRSIVDSESLNTNDPMLERALLVLGDRWTAHVIASTFLRLRKFKDFETALMIAPNILSDRLSRLVDLGVMKRQAYQTRPERWEYRLTDMGHDLFPLIVELIRWGDRWLAGTRGPPLLLYHRPCGRPLVSKVTCDQCEDLADLRTVSLRPNKSRKGRKAV